MFSKWRRFGLLWWKNNKGVERNKVKARVISQALENIIRESSEVFVMGHKNPDMDCFGAALGVMAICKELKEKIVIWF